MAKSKSRGSNSSSSSKGSNGSPKPSLLLIALGVATLAVAAGWFMTGGSSSQASATTKQPETVEEDFEEDFDASTAAGELVVLDTDSEFVCGSIVSLRGADHKWMIDTAKSRLRQALMRRRGASAVSIAGTKFNDEYCDCPDGSDEPVSGACAKQVALYGDAVQFECLSLPSQRVPLSQVKDGVADCCDGSDESGLGAVSAEHVAKCEQIAKERVANKKAEVEKLEKSLAAKESRQTSAAKFRKVFQRNITRDSKQLDGEINRYNKLVRELQTSTEQPDEETYERINYMGMRVQQMMTINAGRKRMLKAQAFGSQFEYAHLFEKCFTHVQHEKVFRGGSAEPEQYNVRFEVCPFSHVTQLRIPGIAKDIRSYDENAAGQSNDKDEQAQPTLLGSWSDLVPVDAANRSITALDPFGVITADAVYKSAVARRAAKVGKNRSPAGLPQPVHLFTGGEACWEGPDRVVKLMMVCNPTDELLRLFENGKCRYEVSFGTPSACTTEMLKAAQLALVAAEGELAAVRS